MCMHIFLGSNANGCSGIDNNSCSAIGGDKCCITPRKVDALCKIQITNIVCGGYRHILAITKSGQIYSWGYNSNGELGHGSTSSVNPAPTKIAKLEQFQVKQIACGYHHSMALTKDGKVFLLCTHTEVIVHIVCYFSCCH